MRLSQVSFSRSVNVPGVGYKDGVQENSPGLASIERIDETVTITTKTGAVVLVPWAMCTQATPAPIPVAPKK